ncbi:MULTISPECIES: hypothetical protein [unclassified Anaeromassilibacillus]|uniref:hypothetical protein n=1 Tax=unclassified Anaeromassilibacillus TaxID=2625359 RepID=UPI00129A5D4D|nr:hypothetical protein [Anaeromassilibacillus sp. Marseille-P3371]MBS6235160.1 hypothetical protein [Clostridiales bacterium]
MPSALLHVQAVVGAAEKAPAGLPVMAQTSKWEVQDLAVKRTPRPARGWFHC